MLLYDELVKKSLGTLLRGFPRVVLNVDRPIVDQMIEDVVKSNDEELIAAFRNGVIEYASEFDDKHQMPAFTLEICSQFFCTVSTVYFENSASSWLDFLKDSFYVFRSRDLVGRTSFVTMWKAATARELTRSLNLEGDLLKCCTAIYMEGTVRNHKFEREALLDLIRLLISRTDRTENVADTIHKVIDFIALEYAKNDLREGDYAEVTHLLCEDKDYLSAEVCQELEASLCANTRITANAVGLLRNLEDCGKIAKVDRMSPVLSARVRDALDADRAKHGDAEAFEAILLTCHEHLDKFAEALEAAHLYPEMKEAIRNECLRRLDSIRNGRNRKHRSAVYFACRRFCPDLNVTKQIIDFDTEYFLKNSKELLKFLGVGDDLLRLNTGTALEPLVSRALADVALPANTSEYGYWDTFEKIDNSIQCLQSIAAVHPELIEGCHKEAILKILLNEEVSHYVRISAISMLSSCCLPVVLAHIPTLITNFELRPVLLSLLAKNVSEDLELAENCYLLYYHSDDDGLLQPLNSLFEALKLQNSAAVHDREPPKMPTAKDGNTTKKGAVATLDFIARQLEIDPENGLGSDCHGD
ncbi:hypothetical protein QR680_005560 [Steinernema hermaphroditum]|uniref:Uncharacterized protein n=1 Tax=Steinernema hermaphroditum TaxID=289476 RepID=A0AA39HSG9_9BILA|nr:hypothetical protein QR680_005560 [Steinernema hermaphroditum]